MSTGTGGYYPQEPYYAPGWSAPAAPEPPRRSRRGRWVAVVAIALLVLGLLTWGLVTLRLSMQTRTLGAVEEPTTTHSRRLDVGHCLATLPGDGDVASVDLVPCADPHAAEVVGVHTFRADAWPGRDAVEADAVAACEMDTRQAELGFRPVVWTPSESSWGQGDRRGLCLAALDEGTARGSFTTADDVTVD
ncbi:hypothetical protein ICW40_08300 [Actinotalea ferrariae]|uniref:septum formation family protein n=1 Tax=Actinotalea ferrariae TaxID=1386098 RepID=UPI001C8B6881|nr:septum formation family protein [Actinotalea ferrariae]MBX9244810.1 hypothetical protein [Actinotalea ferrariae]